MGTIEILLAKANNPSTFRSNGNYTIPRSFGVYKLAAKGNVGRRFRFGNHPVRMNELLCEYGDREMEALFLDRDDAKELARILNA
ncbi:MAG TPA: hypothetical protein PKD26_01515 [Pyrinomonadaceae bacterium]|nr:hypothetical protein [Pyrinomonadaceae bacterium]